MFDCLIKNAEIIDGSGAPSFSGDVALSGGAIAAVGHFSDEKARRVLDAGGKVLTPGFLDIHRHGDAALFRPDYGKAELAQGLTTVLNGNCGLSLAPICGPHAPEILRYLAPITGEVSDGRAFPSLSDYFSQAAQVPLRLNVGMLAGAGVLRADVAGYDPAPLSNPQLHALHHLLEQSLADGAAGVSLGLGYAPEGFYTTKQLIAALSPLKDSGTVITVHMRQEGDGVVDALREMIEVARALRTPVEISHLKSIGKRNWRSAVPEMLALIADTRADGVDVTCDGYPYTAGSTQLIHVLPPEFQAGGLDALTARLQNPADRTTIRKRMETGTDFENITLLSGFENVLAGTLHQAENRPFEGKSIAKIAQIQNINPYDALFDLLASEGCTVSMIDFIAAEDDIADILRAPFSSVISDATYPTAAQIHPRVYGMTAHLIEHFVRENHVLTLPEAVNRLTRRPADRFGLAQKGRIEVGADADLCLFDPAAIHENSTYGNPRQYAQGMDYVFVGGEPAIAGGKFTDTANGKLVK